MKQPSTLHKRNMVETGFNSLYVFRIYKHDKGNIENNKIVSAAHMWDMAKKCGSCARRFWPSYFNAFLHADGTWMKQIWYHNKALVLQFSGIFKA